MTTAAAIQAQIASQKQRLEALEATMNTMAMGMDKHMVQVQLKYAHGYLEALTEQLELLQGTGSNHSAELNVGSGSRNSLESTTPSHNNVLCTQNTPFRTHPVVAAAQSYGPAGLEQPNTTAADAAVVVAAHTKYSLQPPAGNVVHVNSLPAPAAAAAASQAVVSAAAKQHSYAVMPEYFAPSSTAATSYAQGAATTGDDDWVCLQRGGEPDNAQNAQQAATSWTAPSRWGSVWSWGRANKGTTQDM